MNTPLQHNFNSCVSRALSLVTDLNRRGFYANIRLGDDDLHVTVPAYADNPAMSLAIKDDCTHSDCIDVIGPLEQVLKHFIDAELRTHRLSQFLDTLPDKQLDLLMSEPKIIDFIRAAAIRRHHAPR